MAGTADLLTIEIAKGKGPFETILAGDWSTIARVENYSSVAGRGLPYGPFPGRTASVTCFDPDHGLDPDLDPDLDVNTPMRSVLTANGTDYVRFFGYFDAESLLPAWPENEYVTFTATDASKFVGRETNLGLGVVAEERSSDRFGRVLDEIGVASSMRDIEAGCRYLVEKDLSIDAVSALNACVTAEGPMAAWFVTREGTVRFDGRHCYRTRSRISTEQEFFTDVYGDMVFFAGTRYGRNPERHRSEQTLFNRARITNADGVTVTAKNQTSIDRRGRLSWPDVTTETRADPGADAQMIVDMFGGAPETYIRQIVVAPAADGTVLERAADKDLRDRFRVKHTRVNAASTIDKDYTVEQITETAPAGGLYTFTFTLFPTTPMDGLSPEDWLLIGTDEIGTASWAP